MCIWIILKLIHNLLNFMGEIKGPSISEVMNMILINMIIEIFSYKSPG